jgi:polyvinyl alcohol dehydrogenase (cytochrome)
MLTVATLAMLAVGVAAAVSGAEPSFDRDWRMIGHDAASTHNQPFEHALSRRNVGRMTAKWVHTTSGDVSATPAVADGAVYFPDWGGSFWKLDADTGRVIWSRSIADYVGVAGALSRTSPIVRGRTVYIFDLNTAQLLAINTRTGELRWKSTIDPHPAAIATGSPVIVGDRIYMGLSSRDPALSRQNGTPCCTFRGSLVALDANTGQILWKTYVLPDNGGLPTGYAGGTILNPPAVDVADGLVFAGVGNLYTQPASVAACLAAAPNHWSEACIPPDAHFHSLVAFDADTGAIRWSFRAAGHDAWEIACGGLPASVTWCSTPDNFTNWDFAGSGPNVFRVRIDGRRRTVVGVGQKSGVYWLFDAASGTLLWHTLVGPGSDQGGMEWGTATDGRRVYVAIGNLNHQSYVLQPSGETATGGSWAALDASTGQILWQTADPQGAVDLSPLTIANGVVYAGSMARTGPNMYALDAATGTILWQFESGGSVVAGPAVSRGTVYWGSGYSRAAGGAGNNKFYAFAVGRGNRDDGDESGD